MEGTSDDPLIVEVPLQACTGGLMRQLKDLLRRILDVQRTGQYVPDSGQEDKEGEQLQERSKGELGAQPGDVVLFEVRPQTSSESRRGHARNSTRRTPHATPARTQLLGGANVRG